MGKRAGSKNKSNAAIFKAKRPSTIEQIEMLRNFCPSFTENDLSTCLSQAGYNVELAAERLLSGQYNPAKSAAAKPVNIVSISSVKRAPTPRASSLSSSSSSTATTTTGTTTPSSASAGKKRPSPDSSSATTSSISRPEKKRFPHVIPPTPASSIQQQPKTPDIITPALLLCERWLVGTCTTRRGQVSHQEPLEMSHYNSGHCISVRFRGTSIEGNLCRSLSAMLTPLLRHQPKLIELRAEALMDDRNIPIGGEVPLKLTVYFGAPRAFFALFEEEKGKSDSKSSSSMFFSNRGKAQRKKSNKMSLLEAAFAFLQWAQYGDLPEIPDFTPVKTDDNNSKEESSDTSDEQLLEEEDFATEDGKEERPEWAKSVTESDKQSASLPEMEDPLGFSLSIVLRPYQRQALYWMMRREQQGESREELEKELKLLSELAADNGHQNNGESSLSSWPGDSSNFTKPDIYCDCGPVQVSETAKKKATTLDGEANPVNHPLWKTRYLGNHNLEGATLFYVNELLGIATCQPPAPPKQCSGGILADDMGLGKTVMLLALILKCKEESENKQRGSTLVVAPLSLISQWEEEIETKTGLSYLVWYGDQTKGKSSEEDFDCDIVITSYGTVQAELQKKLKKEKSNGRKGLLGREWLRVILDEAHCIKNQATLASKACCSLNATYRWAVTGTVIHNSLDDVYALIKFLQHQPWCEPGFWKAAISNEMNRTEDDTEATGADGAAEPTGMMVALGRVRRLLGPLMLRRTKESVSADGKPILTLPPIEAKVVDVLLTNPEREFYNALLEKSLGIFDGFIKSGTASKSWLAIFSLLARLRMACDHIALTVKSHIDEEEWNLASSKDGSKNEAAAVSPSKDAARAQTCVDDAFITGLLKKFKESAGAKRNCATDSYSDKVARALNEMIKDNATHISDECSICLETPLIHEACITNSCAHIFCRECLLGAVKNAPDCPVCQAKVEPSKIIVLAKGEKGGYTSAFLSEKKKPPTPIKVRAKNDAARQVLENAVNGAKSSKLAAVMRELHRVWELDPGCKVLIFSQFLGFLDLLETSLREENIVFGRLDGKMTLKQRVAALDLFKEDSQERMTSAGAKKGCVMLVSMKAGGVGLNLCAASTVFIVDPWWNQSIEDQCINRVHRIGQKAETVRVRKFVVQDSVEERIAELQKKKKNMASEVYSDINTDGSMSARPTIDDFKMIFGNL